MIEVLENGDNYLYGEVDPFMLYLDFSVINIEEIDGVIVRTLSKIEHKKEISIYKPLHEKYRFVCCHGNDIEYLSINSLPSEGWEELIECWSCHNNEFKSVLDLKIRPRPKGILLSHLYFILNNEDLPACCSVSTKTIRKIFMNEVAVDGYTNQFFLFQFLKENFKMNIHFLYTFENKAYEMTYFYKCRIYMLENGNLNSYNALKVGVKETNKKVIDKESINNYFVELLHTKMVETGIRILGYDVGFILER